MNNDIRPPKRPSDLPVSVPARSVAPVATTPSQPASAGSARGNVTTPVVSPDLAPTPTNEQVAETPVAPSAKSPRTRRLKWIAMGLLLVIILGCAALFGWYQLALRPVASGAVDKVRVAVEAGTSPTQIGQLLVDKKVIRDKNAFEIYTRLTKTRNQLKAGVFSLSPSESTDEIVAHLVAGATEQYSVTFYPGATLNIASTSTDKTPSHRQVFEKLGFKAEEIDAAFAADYSKEYPVLFAGKPASADLEGYIYGETYQVTSGSSVKQILMRTFDEYEAKIKENNLVDAFKQHDLSLYEGITLASIIQREVPTQADQKQVAQIFYTRLKDGMMLGSDVTYHYATDKAGVPRDHTYESPYNTRIHTGLPPGPIASPGISSLLAVASPSEGNYVYFLSGDDGKTYFAHTNEEHEANIVDHCAVKCSLP